MKSCDASEKMSRSGGPITILLFIKSLLLNLSKRKLSLECHKVYSSKVINKLTSLGWLTFAPMHVIGRGRYDEI